MSVKDKIEQQLKDNKVVLYMKGTPEFPQCGFSANAVNILKACGTAFYAVDVLADQDIRDGIKIYGNWPTIPQLYIRGELIGGSDIMTELYQRGELQSLLSA